jgi:hypothetical protein
MFYNLSDFTTRSAGGLSGGSERPTFQVAIKAVRWRRHVDHVLELLARRTFVVS